MDDILSLTPVHGFQWLDLTIKSLNYSKDIKFIQGADGNYYWTLPYHLTYMSNTELEKKWREYLKSRDE